ncbi:hypothetical protein CspHIS471_0407200 [Cutaneotrichosporon sp. HIS471]|nr:hypothetical protein CspHIS471_0407200 [Cutaneotrichosporon sp. HIS471]
MPSISKEVDAGTFKRLKRANQLVADLSAAGKALPAWLFTPPSEAQRVELDAIGVFGTDPFKPEPESLDSNRPTSHLESNGHSGSLTNGTQYLRTESPRAQPLDGQTQYLPESPTHESLHESAQVPPTSQSPNEPHAQPAIDTSPPLRTGRFETPSDSDDDDSDSIPIPIRFTARRTKPPRRQGFKPSPQVPRAWSQPTGETDEDDLSDYEKEQRRAQKRPVPCESQGVSEESVAKSQDSGSFNLSRFPQSAPLPSSPVPASGPHVSSWAPQISSSAPAHVLVPTTDESMRTDPGPEPEPEPEASPPIPAPELPTPSMPRKRPRNSGASNVDADDEASQERPRKQAKAEIVSPIKSSWEPTPGQRVPSTVARPRQVSVSVSEAVRQVLPRYRPDLTTFTVPGMSKEMVESVRAKAVEEKAARERGRRQSGR